MSYLLVRLTDDGEGIAFMCATNVVFFDHVVSSKFMNYKVASN